MSDYDDDFTIDPEDQHLADEITNFDPVHDVAGPVRVKGFIRPIDEVPLSALPPHLAEPVRQRLANTPDHMRADEERRLIGDVLLANSLELRIRAGAGEGANEFQREFFSILKDRGDEVIKADAIDKKLEEIAGYDNRVDPATGKSSPVPVMRYQGRERDALERQLAFHRKNVELLEGERRVSRLRPALKRAVEDRKRSDAAEAERAEVKRRAEDTIREERINRQAEAHAKLLRNRT